MSHCDAQLGVLRPFFTERNGTNPLSCIGGFRAFMRFSDAIDQFVKWKQINVSQATINGYSLDLRGFCLYMRNPEIEAVRIEDIIEYFDLMRTLGWKWNGFLTKSIALRKFFEFWAKQNYRVLNYNLIPIPRREYNPPKVASLEDHLKILSVIPETKDHRHIRNRAIINLLWDTGARNNELMSLNVGDLNFKENYAVIKTEKSRGMKPYRQIFWEPRTTKCLQEWLARRKELEKMHKFADPDALFVGCLRWQIGKRLTNSAVSIFLRHYSARAGIETVNAHSYRHRFGIELAKKGANNSTISGLMGHASLTSSFRYTMLRDNELSDQYKKYQVGRIKSRCG